MFKRGDVVRLKSGGPSVTVLQCKNGLTDVIWWTSWNDTKTAQFCTDVLVIDEFPRRNPWNPR